MPVLHNLVLLLLLTSLFELRGQESSDRQMELNATAFLQVDGADPDVFAHTENLSVKIEGEVISIGVNVELLSLLGGQYGPTSGVVRVLTLTNSQEARDISFWVDLKQASTGAWVLEPNPHMSDIFFVRRYVSPDSEELLGFGFISPTLDGYFTAKVDWSPNNIGQ